MNPILSAIGFGDPLMLVGLTAAALPIVLHLRRRVRAPELLFPTLRFIRMTIEQTARQRRLQEWLLLMLRMLVFALIATALAAPLVHNASPRLAYGFVAIVVLGIALCVTGAFFLTGALQQKKSPTAPATSPTSPTTRPRLGLPLLLLAGAILRLGSGAYGLGSDRFFSSAPTASTSATACAIILDNSPSMLATQDSQTRLAKAQQICRQLVNETIRPAELAILPTVIGDISHEGMTTDRAAALGPLETNTPRGPVRPMRERIRSAAEMLAQSRQPGRLLIILSDFAQHAFADTDVFSGIRALPDTQVVLLPIGGGLPLPDVGIERLTLQAGQPVAGNPLTLEVGVVNNASAAAVRDVELLIDDQPAPTPPVAVQLGAAGSPDSHTTAQLTFHPTLAGPHVLSVHIKDAADALEWDDSRAIAVTIADRINALVVGPEPSLRPRSMSYFVSAALNPFTTGKTAWGITPRYIPIDHLAATPLDAAAIFLCDVPALSDADAQRLQQYATAGGHICFFAGPTIDPSAWNRTLLPHQLLPAALDRAITSDSPLAVDSADLADPLLTGLFDTQEPFRVIVTTGHWSFAGSAALAGHPLIKLADASPLMIARPLGSGAVYTVLTSVAGNWSNLPTTAPFLPLMVRIALAASGTHERTVAPSVGETVTLDTPAGLAPQTVIDVTAPQAATATPVHAATVADLPRWQFNRTDKPGTYAWQTTDGKARGLFAINPPGDEATLAATDVAALARSVPAQHPALVASTPEELARQLTIASTGTSLMPGIVALVVILTLAEALLANRKSN
jgi:hypothetical protein